MDYCLSNIVRMKCLKIIKSYLDKDRSYYSLASNLHLKGRTQGNLGFLTVFVSILFIK